MNEKYILKVKNLEVSEILADIHFSIQIPDYFSKIKLNDENFLDPIRKKSDKKGIYELYDKYS